MGKKSGNLFNPSIELALTVFLGILLFDSVLSIKKKIPYTVVHFFNRNWTSYNHDSGLSVPYRHPVRAMTNKVHNKCPHFLGTTGRWRIIRWTVVPPLIFEAMIHIKSTDLKAILRPSLFLATIGVGEVKETHRA